MIIVDTNVISEMMREQRDAAVTRWLDRQSLRDLYLTSINLAELLTGVEQMPDGKRKTALTILLKELVDRFLPERFLLFDEPAARMYALQVSRARSQGRAIAVADGQIAAIAAVHGFAVATRDTGPFEAAGVAVVNPWVARQ